MQLTARDLALFRAIQSYALLTSQQINVLIFPEVDRSTVLRRLRKLEQASFIRRLSDRLDPVYWCLTKKAAALVSDRPTKMSFRPDQLEHDQRLAQLRIALEDHGVARSWKPEHELRSEAMTKYGLREITHRVIPDGLIGVDGRGKPTTLALELELHPKNQRRYGKTLGEYEFQVGCDAVWYVVRTYVIGRMLEKARGRYGYGAIRRSLHWSVLDEVLSNPLRAAVYDKENTTTVAQLWSSRGEETPREPAHPLALGMTN